MLTLQKYLGEVQRKLGRAAARAWPGHFMPQRANLQSRLAVGSFTASRQVRPRPAASASSVLSFLVSLLRVFLSVSASSPSLALPQTFHLERLPLLRLAGKSSHRF